jgi:predicted transcriptional regulator
MAAEKKVNYTEAQTAQMIADYQAGQTVEAIAEAMGKAVRSVRSKLVREGVYVAPEKAVKAKREEGPTKKELIRELEAIAPFEVEGLMNATKEAIQSLIDLLQPKGE